MATVDMTQRKLIFPPRFIPYLEKHRIFELLHELVELLVQVKPRDHIGFLKKILPCAAKKRDKARIVFLTPPGFDRDIFAEEVSECLCVPVINRTHVEKISKEKILKEETKIQEYEESIKEESCICPAEEETFVYPMYYPEPEEPVFTDEEGKSEGDHKKRGGGDKEEEEEEDEEEKPCICVCPCVKKQQEEEGGGGGEEEKEEEEKAYRDKEPEGKEKGGKKGRRGVRRGEKGERAGEGEERGEFEEKEEEEEEEEGEEEEKEKWGEETYELPCEPEKKKKKRKKVKSISTETEKNSSIVDINYAVLADCEIAAKGWILSDFPTNAKEAEHLSKIGVLPTHAFRIILNEEEEMKNREYKWNVIGWKKVYEFIPVTEIRIGERTMQELTESICNLLTVMPHRHAPMLPRIVIIGSRGAGVTTQAQKLAKKYGMIHVEFEIVIARTLQQDDEISKMYKQQLATRVEPEVEAVILEKVLLSAACRNRGWVLTGYPKNIDQMRMLDIMATPPNRVIFLEVPARECFVRLYYRKIDPCLGDEYKLPKIEPFGLDSYVTPDIDPEIADRLVSHPKNNKKQIIHDIESYFLQKNEMMAYCGKTASYVDGDKSVDATFEMIEKVIINPAPAHGPRNPLAVHCGIEKTYKRLKKFRLSSGMYFNNLTLNPPEAVVRLP